MTVKELRTFAGLTQQQFSDFYEIPKRSIENWESGQRTPPPYLLKLLERVVREDFKKE